MTTHEMMIAFDFDDESVRRHIEKNLYKDVAANVSDWAKDGIEKCLPKKSWSNGEVDWAEVSRRAIGAFIEEHSDEVIDLVALTLAKRVGGKKAYKEALDEAKMELSDGED